MGAADKEEHGKEKENENDKEEDEEAQAVKRWSEALVGGGFRGGNFSCSAHASELDYEDYSEDPGPDDYELLDSDQDGSENVSSGERDSREHGLQSPGALLAVPVASSSSHGLQQLLSPSSDMPSSVSVNTSAPSRIIRGHGSLPSAVAVTDSNGRPDGERRGIWLGLPSNKRLHKDTLCFLKDCELPVPLDNPRQLFAQIPQIPNLEVYFQNTEDIVKLLLSGDLDMGIVGLDTVSEYGQGKEDLIIVHNALGYGHCYLSLEIPKEHEDFEKINSVMELSQMPKWNEKEPLVVATSFPKLGQKFMKEKGLKHVRFFSPKGAVEVAPKMGTAHVVLDLVNTGETLRANNLREIDGGIALESQAVLVASRKSLLYRVGALGTTHEILKRLEEHLKAVGQFKVTGYMSGSSFEEVAEQVFSQLTLSGLEEPAIHQVFHRRDGEMVVDSYAIDICGPKELLDSPVQQQLRAMGACRVQVSQITKIYDQVNSKWQELRSKLGEENLSKLGL